MNQYSTDFGFGTLGSLMFEGCRGRLPGCFGRCRRSASACRGPSRAVKVRPRPLRRRIVSRSNDDGTLHVAA